MHECSPMAAALEQCRPGLPILRHSISSGRSLDAGPRRRRRRPGVECRCRLAEPLCCPRGGASLDSPRRAQGGRRRGDRRRHLERSRLRHSTRPGHGDTSGGAIGPAPARPCPARSDTGDVLCPGSDHRSNQAGARRATQPQQPAYRTRYERSGRQRTAISSGDGRDACHSPVALDQWRTRFSVRPGIGSDRARPISAATPDRPPASTTSSQRWASKDRRL